MYQDEHNQTGKNIDLYKQIDIKEEELQQLKSQMAILENGMKNKDQFIQTLKEENALYQDKNSKWIKKLDDEIERNANNVESLQLKIQ